MNNFTYYESSVRPQGEIFIGSSDIPIIIKTRNSRIKKSQYELWQEKLNMVEAFSGNEYTTWGHELEPLLIAAFIKRKYDSKIAYKFKVDYILHQEFRDIQKYNPPTIFKPFTECRHHKFTWALAHADCLALDEKKYIIEAKTGGYFARVKRENTEGFDLEDHTINGVPSDIILQVQWQMLCYNVDMTYVLLLVDDNKFHIYEVPAMKNWWPLMIEKASRFLWHCQNNKPPQPEKYDDIEKLFPEVLDRAVYLIAEKAVIAEQMHEEKKKLEQKKSQIEKRIEDIKDAAALLMGDSKYLYNGETSEKLFQQVITKDQYNMIHPNTILKESPEAFKILEEKKVLKKSDRRYIR